MAAAVARQKRHAAPRQRAEDVVVRGRPNGVSRSASSCASNPGMEYSPLPPIIPISAFNYLLHW